MSDSWQAGTSGDWSAAADWSTGTPSSSATAVIGGAGAYVVTLFGTGAAAGLILNGAGAEFYDAGVLTLSGTAALQAGTLDLAYGTILGGTLVLDGGLFTTTGGTLNGTAVDGALSLAGQNDSLVIENGLAMARANGSGGGTLAITGGDALLDFAGGGTLAGAAVSLGAGGAAPGQMAPATLAVTDAAGATAGATLTLDAFTWLRGQGQGSVVVGNLGPAAAGPPAMLINLGTISAGTTGTTLSIAGSGTLVNQGTIAVANGAVLALATAGLVNQGTIAIDGGTLALGGTFASVLLSELGQVVLSAGTVALAGLVELGGGTLALGAGSAITGSLGALALTGTLAGGTVADPGGGLTFAAGTGVLAGVTYAGALTLAGTGVGLTLTQGSEVTGAGGGAGSIVISGAGATLDLQGSETLDNATITLGSALGSSGAPAAIGTSDPWLASVSTTATLGSQLAVVQGGASAALLANGWSPVAGFGPADTLVNLGRITGDVAGGQLSISGYGTFINAGSIAISGGDTLSVTVGRFANAGTLTVGEGGVAVLGTPAGGFGATSAWSNAGTIAVAGGTLVLQGSEVTASLGGIAAASGDVVLAGTLANAGATLALGGALRALTLSGTIAGGVIGDAGGLLTAGAAGTGVLSGVAYRGTLALAQAGATLTVANGLSLAGTALVEGQGSLLDFSGAQTVTGGTVLLGAAAGATLGLAHDYGEAGASVLTLGAAVDVVQAGAIAVIGGAGAVAGDAIVSQGTILAAIAGGTLVLQGPGFSTSGSIAVSNGDTLAIDSQSFSNTGVISVTNACLSLGGSLTLAGLGDLRLNNATLSVGGTLDLAGSTLAVGPGSRFGRIALAGTLANGVIADSGQGFAGLAGAALDNVTFAGVLDLSRPFAQLTSARGLTLTGAGGSGRGSILLTGAQARLTIAGSETLDNCAISLGSAGQVYNGQTLTPAALAPAAGVQLTLGAGTTLSAVGAVSLLGNAAQGVWTDSIVNAGLITDQLAGDTLAIGSTVFDNIGRIAVSGGGVLVLGDAAFTNAGTLSIGHAAVVQVSLYDFFASPVSGPTVFTNAGTIVLAGGVLHEMTAGGLFPPVAFANAKGSQIGGAGAFLAPVTNSGTIAAEGGTLSIGGTILGTGTLLIGAGATLNPEMGVASGQLAAFASSTGTLRLNQPGQFAGTLSGYVAGDVIDLPGRAVSGVAISNGTLAVNTPGQLFRFASTVKLAGALEAGRDGHGGATIAIIPRAGGGGVGGGGVGGGPTVLEVTQPGMLFWTTPSGDILLGTAADMQGTVLCNWSAYSRLDITDIAAAGAHLAVAAASGGTRVTLTGGGHSTGLMFQQAFGSADFHLQADGHGGCLILFSG